VGLHLIICRPHPHRDPLSDKKICYSESNIYALSSFSTENFKADLHYFFPNPSYWTLKIVLTSHWMPYNLCSSKIHRLGSTNVRSLPHYKKIMLTTHYSKGQTVPTYTPIQIFWTRLNTKVWRAVSLLSQRCIQYIIVKICCLASADIIKDSRTEYKWTNSKILSEVNLTAFEVTQCYVPWVSEENNEKSGTAANIPTEIQCRNLLKVKLAVLTLEV
jgi:hypothetical protein